MSYLLDILLDALIDSLKLLPFLFLTYLLMEFIERYAEEKTEKLVKKSGPLGPVIGAIIGVVPQCGFSTAAANLYAGRLITAGTLIAVFLSTSDEMVPIFLSEASNGFDSSVIIKVMIIKIIVGLCFGLLIDYYLKLKHMHDEHLHIHDICEHDHCHCEKGILHSTLSHTIKTFSFIFIASLFLGLMIHFIGEDTIKNIAFNKPFIGEVIAALIGLIPNCAASIIISELFVSGVMSFSAMIAGLLSSAGVGILVLLRVNNHPMQNIKIISTLYVIAVIAGVIIRFIPV